MQLLIVDKNGEYMVCDLELHDLTKTPPRAILLGEIITIMKPLLKDKATMLPG